jgi:HPt (histidine-containing phosphotransfer) domain-containing protein
MDIHTVPVDATTVTYFQPIVGLREGVSVGCEAPSGGPTGQTDSADEPFNPAALDMLRRLGKETLLVRMIDIFLVSSQERIAAARAALQEDDMPSLKLAVHSMKSSAAQLGGVTLQRTAAAAERAVTAGDSATLPAWLDAIDTEFASLRTWLYQARAVAIATSNEKPT